MKVFIWTVVGLTALVVLGALVTGPQQTLATRESATTAGNRAHALLLRATNAERLRALAAMVEGSGERCEVPATEFLQGLDPKTGDAWWNIDCARGGSYIVRIKNDAAGSTQVMSCALFERVTNNKCFVSTDQWK